MEHAEIDKALVLEIVDQVNRMSLEDVKGDLEMMEPEEVADKLKMGRSTVYHYAEVGKIPAWKMGTLVRFRPRALLSFILYKEKMAQAA
jgi:excisionase family DNA binding protein